LCAVTICGPGFTFLEDRFKPYVLDGLVRRRILDSKRGKSLLALPWKVMGKRAEVPSGEPKPVFARSASNTHTLPAPLVGLKDMFSGNK